MPRSPRTAALAAAALALALAPARAQEIDHSWVQSFEPEAKSQKVFDDEVAQALRDRLGGLATNLQVVVAACESEYFAREGLARLNGNWSVAASRGAGFEEGNWYNDEEGYRTKKGIKINANPEYAHGWGPQYVKGIQTDADRTAKKLFDYANANDYQRGGKPRFESGGTGKDAKVYVKDAKNVAALWQDHCPKNDMVGTTRQVLRGAGFANAEIDLAYNNGKNDVGFIVDRAASRDELLGATGIIKSFRDKLNDATESEKRALLILWGHGGLQKRKAPKAPDKSPGGSGLVVLPSSPPVPLAVDPRFAQVFFRGMMPEPTLAKGSNPGVQVSTVWESWAGPVAVTLDGVFAGVVQLGGSSQGGYYDLEISDATWHELFQRGALWDGMVAVRFNFPAGAFQFATEEDFALGRSRSFGLGLSTAGLAFAGLTNPLCPADYDSNGFLDGRDFQTFQSDFATGDADWNGDGVTDPRDFSDYQAAFQAGC